MDRQYDMEELRAVLRFHAQKYPLIDILDAAKLIYQHVLGCEHAIIRPYSAYSFLKEEIASVRQQSMPLLEDIGNGFSRVELRALEANGVSADELFDWFYVSSQYRGDTDRFIASLQLLREPDLGLGFDGESVDGYCGSIVVPADDPQGGDPQTFGILAHLDVVPESTGWDYPPYGAVIADG